MRAPILLRQSATSTISGSRAALAIRVAPWAIEAAIIARCVPPTVTLGNSISPPVSPFGARATALPASISIDAPSFSSAIRRRSTGRVPMAHPPGSDTRASPMRATSGAMTQKLARMRDTSSYGAVVSTIVRALRCAVWPVPASSPARLPSIE